jgi:hypothetical protein
VVGLLPQTYLRMIMEEGWPFVFFFPFEPLVGYISTGISSVGWSFE